MPRSRISRDYETGRIDFVLISIGRGEGAIFTHVDNKHPSRSSVSVLPLSLLREARNDADKHEQLGERPLAFEQLESWNHQLYLAAAREKVSHSICSSRFAVIAPQ